MSARLIVISRTNQNSILSLLILDINALFMLTHLRSSITGSLIIINTIIMYLQNSITKPF